ncbi:S46 family peptidase [Cesiribacter andamanensis]|uniref:Dipeptidyl-peptidase n=1 Tax=Cesiribacter andamanensis AMV16 TaxID=1279009 RepID=M7N743_9BACT|nr:S46 family peptidase [Cesiribacter andamanensis]EMR03056.1 Peptidase S46 [Cesiribacter andamanensis AMV16]
MYKRLVLLVLAGVLSLGSLYANEGMWLPLLVKRLNEADMQKMGLQLTAEEIYSVNQSSLKDAIVSLGGFCTAEVISSQGLLLTNHHCAYGAIQTHSSVEQDYLSDGFWAKTKADELPNKGLYARFLVRMEDVSQQVLAAVKEGMSEEERAAAIAAVTKTLSEQAKGNSHYDVVVRDFFHGNEFYLFVYETFTDVRLVGAPPESIGKYGGDTDNWMWPRHTGDFALFRVYSAPDGKPAPYAAENVPLKPKHHLPVSLQGVQEGDFAMVFGYPGSTDRYLTSYGVKQALEQTNPTRVKIRDLRLKLLKEDMDKNKDVRIKYASKYASVANYWKYFIGQSKGLENLDVLSKKETLEQEFTTWVNASEDRKKQWAEALPLVQQSYEQSYEANLSYLYLAEAALGTEIIRFANTFRSLETALMSTETDQARIASLIASLQERTSSHFKDYNAPTDRKVMEHLLRLYYQDVPKKDHPEIFQQVEKKYKGNFVKWAADVFAKSMFASEAATLAFLQKPELKKLQADPAFAAASSIINKYNKEIYPRMQPIQAQREKGNRLFVQGLRQMQPDRKFYPNANSTMRLTYGTVGSYAPRDGVIYSYYTTMEGVMQKKDNSDPEFAVPPKLDELYARKDWGPYANSQGELPVAFITNNDITGGNSGSPVLDGKGHLIGVAFDGNWEAMSGDIAFEPQLQRCINVDIRYVLFIIDKFAGAGHLVEEMTLVYPDKDQQDAKLAPATLIKAGQ